MPRSRKRRWLAFGFRAGRALAGPCPPHYGEKSVLLTVGRGPVPRRASIEGNGVGLRAVFARIERSRGTGPRATGKKRAVNRRARACPSPCLGRGNGVGWRSVFARVGRSRGKPARLRVWQARAPALRYARPSPFHRRARACPSPCLGQGNGFGWRAFFAQVGRSRGTGPRATVCQAASLHRRARACPSPCLGTGKRCWLACVFARVGRSRGTGPRATN